MFNHPEPTISRRNFVRAGIIAGGAIGVGRVSLLLAAEPAVPVAPSSAELARRTLGRTGVPVTVMTLGTAPCGFAKGVTIQDIARIVNVAIDLGINSIDTAPAYEKAEEGVGLALGPRRKDVFLATKVGADTVQAAEESLANSLRLLKTDFVDLLYFHSLGNRKLESARDAEGAFTWLLKQKQAGKCRFIGVSGHHLPRLFPGFLESGDVDVLLTVVNFVDRHTYRFEEQVLPVAEKHNVGIVAMKVFGGARRSAGSYGNPQAPPELDVKHLPVAIRYALGVPGVATLNIGAHNEQQVRQNVEMVKNYQPLAAEEQEQLTVLGKELAGQWGPHFGPVA